jgi:2-polyprenyl-3-methyl-5-hydroxy-6-metoxy-1,4-benzoquinol methylase
MKDEFMDQPANKCHICQTENIPRIEEFTSLAQVTSDCRPWKRGGKLGICHSCGFVQKIADDAFMRDCKEIYRTYAVYYQADGKEQKIFEQSKGLSRSRSESILTQLLKQNALPAEGTLLDIGCGNGNLLRSFSKLYPSWILSGLEFDEKNRACIERIENVRAFYSCELMDIAGQFDIISMIHCLEHIVDPVHFLRKVKDKLTTQGLLLVEIPTYTLNPFDLVIADHCMHLDMNNIKNLLEQCGFEIVLASTDIVPKEKTILARKNIASKAVLSVSETALEDSHRGLLSAITWLKENIACASRIAAHDDLGIFGTSISGAWLYNEIPDQISFFVDEDQDRINKLFLGRPVYHPKNLPHKSSVYIPLPYDVASGIAERLKVYGNRFFIPPPF